MNYMVVERFHDGKAREIYERFRAQGRLTDDGLEYIDSWVSDDVSVCFQLMRTEDPALLDKWAARWSDLCDFEIVPVTTGLEAALKVLDD